jgi:hypothetical protein
MDGQRQAVIDRRNTERARFSFGDTESHQRRS